MKSWRVRGGHPLHGTAIPPADKSISHRALMFGGIALGETRIHNLLEGEDCLSTAAILSSLGVEAIRLQEGEWAVQGLGRLQAPDQALDAGNSGTTVRLMAGILAGQPFESTLTGDESLRSRPMKRIIDPLHQMGAEITSEGDRAPLTIRGGSLHGIHYESPVASAQVKSCVLLAGLFAEGETSVQEPSGSRDHTERMLPAFGGVVSVDGTRVSILGGQPLTGAEVTIPGDVSSAAFPLIASLIVDNSSIEMPRVGLNPTRTGILDALLQMNADIELAAEPHGHMEPAGTIRSDFSTLAGSGIGGELIPRLVDEVPALAVAATQATGETIITDAKELRVKESDRLATISKELRKMGARIEETEDGLRIEGPVVLLGTDVATYGDHRIAMSLAIAAMAANGETIIRDVECVDTSFPGFARLMRLLGADIEEI